jgi:hypothetical protein
VSSAPFGHGLGTPRWKTGYENQELPPSLIYGPTGQPYLVWQDAKGRVTIQGLNETGQLGRVTTLSPRGAFGAVSPHIAVDSTGRGIVVWSLAVRHGNVYHNEIQARMFTLHQ